MKNKKFLNSLLVTLSMATGTTLFSKEAENPQPIIYPAVAKNTPYSHVAALPVRAPEHRLAYGEDPLQYGAIWKPVGGEPGKPLVVMIHGGCWLNAFDMSHTNALSTALSQNGYPVWSLEYRRTGDQGGGWPGSFEDIIAGVKAIPQLEKFDVNTDRIIIMGHSAGGHLAMLAGAKWQVEPVIETRLLGIVGLAAITDIKKYSAGSNGCQQATSKFMGGELHERMQAYIEANPVGKQPYKTTLLLQGDKDNIVPVEYANVGHTRQTLVTGVGHFDWVHPGSEAFNVLLRQLELLDDGITH